MKISKEEENNMLPVSEMKEKENIRKYMKKKLS
jgi:hypothetical protein